MQPTHTQTTLTRADAWLSQHAVGLITHAQTNDVFAQSLAAVVQECGWQEGATVEVTGRYAQPSDQTHAVATATWLIQTLQSSPEAKNARGVLATFAQEYNEPKNVVLGIVGIAIIGPTLGLIKTKKKKKKKAQLIAAASWHATQSPKQLLEHSHQLTGQMLAHELQLAGGTISKLHPDMGEWVMSESAVQLSTTSADELASLAAAAANESLSHQVLRENDQPVMVAVSPVVSEEFVNGFDTQRL